MRRPNKYVTPGPQNEQSVSPGLCRLIPVGRLPDCNDHVYGGVPPEANRDPITELPMVASENEVPIDNDCGGPVIVNENCFCTVPFEPETCTVKMVLVAEFGVPDSTPPLLIVNPAKVNVDHVHTPVQPGALKL